VWGVTPDKANNYPRFPPQIHQPRLLITSLLQVQYRSIALSRAGRLHRTTPTVTSNMVQGKKASEPPTNGASKYREQQPNMSFQRASSGNGTKRESRPQNGNLAHPAQELPVLTLPGNASFRTDSAISGGRAQGERTLQRWVPDAPEDVDTSLEVGRMKSSTGAVWDQFGENERLFGLTTDYDENIYTTTIDKSHPQYKQRLAEAEKKAREIERSVATNSHVAEERLTDNLSGQDHGGDEEDK
jgi:PAB1-binding protein PBP1